MSACAQAGRRDMAEKLLLLMQQAGMQPTVQAYTALIHAWVKEGTSASVAAAFAVHRDMCAAGVAPTDVTYSCLLQGCGVVGDVERALGLYQQACSEVWWCWWGGVGVESDTLVWCVGTDNVCVGV